MASRTLRRIDVASAAIAFAVFGAVSGVLVGLLLMLVQPPRDLAFLLGFVGSSTVLGTTVGATSVAVYNRMAGYTGGVTVELETVPEESDDGFSADGLVHCPSCHSVEERARDSCRFCGEAFDGR